MCLIVCLAEEKHCFIYFSFPSESSITSTSSSGFYLFMRGIVKYYTHTTNIELILLHKYRNLTKVNISKTLQFIAAFVSHIYCQVLDIFTRAHFCFIDCISIIKCSFLLCFLLSIKSRIFQHLQGLNMILFFKIK